MNVHTVGNQLGHDLVEVHHRSHDAGLTVVQRAHGVEGVCGMSQTQPHRLGHLIEGCIGVTNDRDDARFNQARDTGHGLAFLWGEGDHADVPVCSALEFFEPIPGEWLEPGRGRHAGLRG